MGVPRILDLLRRHDIKASFFVPGMVALLHPDEQRRVVDEDHEVGMHGWIHEFTRELPRDVERDLMMQSPVGTATLEWTSYAPAVWSDYRIREADGRGAWLGGR